MVEEIKIETPKLFPWQKDVVSVFDDNSNDNILIIKSSRQCGKSALLELLAIRQCVNYERTIVIIVEPTYKQCERVHKEITDALNGLPIVKNASIGNLVIEFTNNSQICLLSAASRDGLRGPHCTKYGFLAIDEAVFITDEIITQCFPFVNVAKSNIIMVSTPKFRSGQFYEYYKLATENTKGVHLIDFTNYDTSAMLSPAKKELYKKSLPANIYKSEILGEWLEMSSDLFGDFSRLINNDFDETNNDFNVGLDFGAGVDGDYTALSIMNGKRQQVFCWLCNDLDAVDTVDEIVRLLQPFIKKGNVKIVAEQNSIGEVYLAMLKRKLPNVQIKKFVTTNESKVRIIQNLQVAFQNGDIQILNNNMQNIQLAGYRAEKTPTGKLTFNNDPILSEHDDAVIALALSLEGIVKQTRYIIM